ncbi:MAG: dipicolinate synthase subunit DpsA [Desulfurispora sp.]|uniref:dipicolinate synthase subunit DpsA n=1 Tax=Desulfurispora sp. TaxID=3014275 RepID=UPI00404B538C
MLSSLSGIGVAMLGGDQRNLLVMQRLVELGATVKVVGLPVSESDRVVVYEDIEHALQGVRAVLLPVPGTDEEGKLHAVYAKDPLYLQPQHLAQLKPGTPLLVGVARPYLRKLVERYKLALLEVMEIDEVAILNSIPSAEGAILLAMQNMPITIHGSQCVVTGFGRTAMTLARMLKALGAHTTVVARSPAQRARAWEMGHRASDLGQLPEVVGRADFIFNTIPAPVLHREVLQRMRPGTLIVDLASAPGGTDFGCAESLGIKAILAPGLPGRYSPRTAGEILADVIPRLLIEAVSS